MITSQLCACGCGDSAARLPNGTYATFALGHNQPGHDAKKYIAEKLKRINAERACIHKMNEKKRLKDSL